MLTLCSMPPLISTIEAATAPAILPQYPSCSPFSGLATLGGSATLGRLVTLGGLANVSFIVVFGELGRRLVVIKTIVVETFCPANRRENDAR